MLNWSQEQLAQRLAENPALRINERYSMAAPEQLPRAAGLELKPSKYRNQKVELDGIVFDSKKEARRYQELKRMRLAGEIIRFELQPEFLLLEGFEKNGEIFRPIYYRADFRVLYPDGHWEVEDTKGVKTKEFILKRKLFEKRYPELSLKVI